MPYVELMEDYDWYPCTRPKWMDEDQFQKAVARRHYKKVPAELRNKLKAAWDELRRITDEIDAYAE